MRKYINKNLGFTITELIISMAIFATIMLMLVSILSYVTSSTSDNQRKLDAISNSSSAKEFTLNTLQPSTAVEFLDPIVLNDLSSYTTNNENDEEFSYLYTLDGEVYYRGPTSSNSGGVVKILTLTDVDFQFNLNSDSLKTLNLDLDVKTKEIDPYLLQDSLNVYLLNLQTDSIVDSRSNTSVPTNIIRFISEEIEIDEEEEDSDIQIVSIVSAQNASGIGVEVPFTVSQDPRVVQLNNIPRYRNQSYNGSTYITGIADPDSYFEEVAKRQSDYLNKMTSAKNVLITYIGEHFIDGQGNVLTGTDNGDGTKTVRYRLPMEQYSTSVDYYFAVTSSKGEYLEYEFKVTTSMPRPEIVRFEFLTEDNYVDQNNKTNLPHDLKAYINNEDVYYAYYSGSSILGTSSESVNGTPSRYYAIDGRLYWDHRYSTIVMPYNTSNGNVHRSAGDYYPTINSSSNSGTSSATGQNYLTTRVATITFVGTALYDPSGTKVNIPPSERSKLDGVSEVSVKVTIDADNQGNPYYLDGEIVEELIGITDNRLNPYKAQVIPSYSFNYNTQKIFAVKMANNLFSTSYVYQSEYGTKAPDYHSGTEVDAGLTKVWLNDYLDGAWVGGSVRGNVGDHVTVSYPYDRFDELESSLKLNATAYGHYLLALPAYIEGTFGGSTNTSSDNLGYHRLNSEASISVQIPSNNYDSSITSTNGNITYPMNITDPYSLKHLLVVQGLNVNGAATPYTVEIVPEYPKSVRAPEVVSVRINDSTNTNSTKAYHKGTNSFMADSSLNNKYKGNVVPMDISFAGSRITISNSMDPTATTLLDIKNPLATALYAYTAEINAPFSQDYYVHLYDYNNKYCETYTILNSLEVKDALRDDIVYSLRHELGESNDSSYATISYNDSNVYKRPFLPIKTTLPGLSYGYDIDTYITASNIINSAYLGWLTQNVLKKSPLFFDINNNGTYNTNDHYNYPLPYEGGRDSSSYKQSFGGIRQLDLNSKAYFTTDSSGSFVSNSVFNYSNTMIRTFIKTGTVRYMTGYTLGGNNLSTLGVYNISTMMTPVIHDSNLTISGNYDTDRFVGSSSKNQSGGRKHFEAKNVKLDTEGFMVHIYADKIQDDSVPANITSSPTKQLATQGYGRPGTMAMTTFDIAVVDKDEFYTDFGTSSLTYSPYSAYTASNYNKIAFNNSTSYKNTSEISTNDILGYGFALVEESLETDYTQNNLGRIGTRQVTRNSRSVSLLFYTRQFYMESSGVKNGSDKIDALSMPKAAASYVKICDIDAFSSNIKLTSNGANLLSLQSVNFLVDVSTTFDGNTKITAANYEEIMKNNYISFVVRELDANGDTTVRTHYQNYSFLDVFGGVRIDDDYKELNLILNHIPRVNNQNVYLSVGYNTNHGASGIAEYTIYK